MRSFKIAAAIVMLTCAALPRSPLQAGSSPAPAPAPNPASPALYDGWQRSSQYVAVRGGTRLALDVFIPSRGGAAATTPLPVIFQYTRYNRRGRTGASDLASDDPNVAALLRHGYVVVVADVRGTGASFAGPLRPGYRYDDTLIQGQDGADLIAWIARQAWSNGKVGMIGRSAVAHVQERIALQRPPALKAIFPEMSIAESYGISRRGGARGSTFDLFAARTTRIPRGAPVDADRDGRLRDAALAEQRTAPSFLVDSLAWDYSDSVERITGRRIYETNGLAGNLSRYPEDLAIYYWGGFRDPANTEQILRFANLHQPRRMTIGPWFHNSPTPEIGAEWLRWFDHWLKGIDNGVMAEPPIRFWLRTGALTGEWRSASSFPLPGEQRQVFYPGSNPAQTSGTLVEGPLLASPPTVEASTSYVVDRSVTTAGLNCNHLPAPGCVAHDDFTPFDRKGLTFTTPPLQSDLTSIGFPVVRLRVSAPQGQPIVIATLEVVDRNGTSHFLANGMLKASMRKLGRPPYANGLGLRFPTFAQADVQPLAPDEPVVLDFSLTPIATRLYAGERIRMTITGWDAAELSQDQIDPASRFTVHFGSDTRIDLPVNPPL